MQATSRSRDDLAPSSRLSSLKSPTPSSSKKPKTEDYLKTMPAIDPEVLANTPDLKGSLADPTLGEAEATLLTAARIDHFSRQPSANPAPAPFFVIEGSALLQREASSPQDEYSSGSSAAIALRNDGVSNVFLPGNGGDDIAKDSVGAIEYAAREHARQQQSSFSEAPAPSPEARSLAAARQPESESILGIAISSVPKSREDSPAPPIAKGKFGSFRRNLLGIDDAAPIPARMTRTATH